LLVAVIAKVEELVGTLEMPKPHARVLRELLLALKGEAVDT
jgi:hypothetical protein